jgi:hypothetical protein
MAKRNSAPSICLMRGMTRRAAATQVCRSGAVSFGVIVSGPIT